MKRIIFSSSDAGGGNAILPLVKKLKKNNFQIICLIGGQSREVFKQANIDFFNGDALSCKDLKSLISAFQPNLFVFGSSLGLTIEKCVLKYCKTHKIKSLCILDFWSNYWQRFSNTKKDFEHLPDTICVMDKYAEKEMINEGFPPGIIKVTGNPYFDEFIKGITSENEEKERILFISQPIRDLNKNKNIPSFGYDEFAVLVDVLEVLNNFPYSFKLIIRSHPKENPDKFIRFIERYKNKAALENISDIKLSLSQSALVIGITSVVLFQAAAARKKVISYQPSLKREDCLVSNRLGLSRLITDKQTLKNVLEDYFQKKNFKLPQSKNKKPFLVKNAADNIIKIIQAL